MKMDVLKGFDRLYFLELSEPSALNCNCIATKQNDILWYFMTSFLLFTAKTLSNDTKYDVDDK